jgi:hypothetical protein
VRLKQVIENLSDVARAIECCRGDLTGTHVAGTMVDLLRGTAVRLATSGLDELNEARRTTRDLTFELESEHSTRASRTAALERENASLRAAVDAFRGAHSLRRQAEALVAPHVYG